MAKSREVRKLAQNRATSSTDNGTMVRLGSLHPQAAHCGEWSAKAHGRTAPVAYLKLWSNLPGSVREGGAQGAIGDGHALVDGGSGEGWLLCGLKAHVIEQSGLGERLFDNHIACDEHFPTSGESAASAAHSFAA